MQLEMQHIKHLFLSRVTKQSNKYNANYYCLKNYKVNKRFLIATKTLYELLVKTINSLASTSPGTVRFTHTFSIHVSHLTPIRPMFPATFGTNSAKG